MLADIADCTDYGPPASPKCVVLRMLQSRMHGMLGEHGTPCRQTHRDTLGGSP
jgi:hypothetical protein